MLKIDYLKKFIGDSHLSIATIERKAGLTRNMLQNILYGKSKVPALSTLRAISEALNCGIKDLIGDEELQSETSFLPWKKEVFIKSIDTVSRLLEKYDIAPHYEYILELINDTYLYTIENETDKCDEGFIKWLIKKKNFKY